MSNLYREPIKHTCPDIDGLLNDLNQTERDFRNFDSDDEKACDAVDDLLYVLRNVYDTLEDLRKSNSTLREWGNDLVSHAESLEEKIVELEYEIVGLEDEIQKLQS